MLKTEQQKQEHTIRIRKEWNIYNK